MATIQELGQKVKAQYPQYANLSDVEVGRRVKQQYPEAYGSFEDVQESTDASRSDTRLSANTKRGTLASFVGGRSLAEGVAGAMVSDEVIESATQNRAREAEQQKRVIDRIREKEARGEDASRLRAALPKYASGNSELEQFEQSLPTNKEVLGSAIQLAGTVALPTLGSNVVSGATGVGAGVLRGAAAGAVEGGVQGFGSGLEEGENLVKSTAQGAGIGAALGGVFGGIAGRAATREARQLEKTISNITPDADQITPTEYKRRLAQGLIEPKTATNPSRVKLSNRELQTVQNNADIIRKDPVKTSINIREKFADLDGEVGKFLDQNNSIFNDAELKNALTNAVDDLDDLNIDPDRLAKAKQTLVDRFVDSLEKNDMKTLWQARKDYDQTIRKAFEGSNSLGKEAQRALRNAVQEFIAERTPDATYKGLMNQMTDLYQIRDLVENVAVKERGASAIRQWIKNNPAKAKAMGWLSGGVLGAVALDKIFD